jgi:hypothetical protein
MEAKQYARSVPSVRFAQKAQPLRLWERVAVKKEGVKKMG